ncbi:MAG: NAD(P)H-hydrate epimerase, partial [Streptosporangiaceae bacterium]
MRHAHGVGKVRAAETALMSRLPEGTLMQRAAAGVAAVSARLLPSVYGSTVVVLAGSGDNGGDALYAGARLARRGARVTAVPVGSRVHERALAALRRAGGRLPSEETAATDSVLDSVLEDADLVLDGLIGIGVRGALRDAYA